MGSRVGYKPHIGEEESLRTSDIVLAGGLSSALTRATCQPLDVLKIRFQLQSERERSTSKYRNIFQATRLIVHEEGVRALWKGHLPAQYLSIVFGVFQFSAFEILTKWTHENINSQKHHLLNRNVTNFLTGGAAGVAGTLVSYPFDVVRTRLVAQGEPKFYKSTRDAVSKIWKNEGYGAFFKGITPTFATIAPYSGAQFGFYTLFTQLWNQIEKLEPSLVDPSQNRISLMESMSCGALAGLCAKTLVFPFDTTKKRMQMKGFVRDPGFGRSPVEFNGMLDCMAKTVKNEGIRGLYRGMTPGLIKAVATTSVHFWFYEYICHLLSLKYRS